VGARGGVERGLVGGAVGLALCFVVVGVGVCGWGGGGGGGGGVVNPRKVGP